MRITDIYLAGFGPFVDQEPLRLNVNDERVLFLGISGSGKSTVFRAAGLLWRQLERYFAGKAAQPLPQGGLAMAMEELPFGSGILAWGSHEFAQNIQAHHPDARLLHIAPEGFLGDWPQGDAADYPNLIVADGESEVRVEWESLLAQCPEGLEAVNRLLVGKKLEWMDGQLIVRLPGGGYHEPGRMSMGERRIACLCAMAAVQLKPGGLLMLDEPDVHLHPSQTLGLLATLENLTLNKNGQMWVISHQEALWRRYEELGLLVALSRRDPHA